MKLDKNQIVAAALTLLDEVGLDRLTTRALADRLGVRQPALYWHFADRRALLDAMNDAMMAEFVAAPAPPQMAWQDFALTLGQRFRGALLSRRDGARVHAGTPANPHLLERGLQVLTAGGLSLDHALHLCMAIGNYTIGWTLEEQAERTQRSRGPALPGSLTDQAIQRFFASGGDGAFDDGLRFMIAGAALSISPPQPPPA